MVLWVSLVLSLGVAALCDEDDSVVSREADSMAELTSSLDRSLQFDLGRVILDPIHRAANEIQLESKFSEGEMKELMATTVDSALERPEHDVVGMVGDEEGKMVAARVGDNEFDPQPSLELEDDRRNRIDQVTPDL